jgi:hypothetical protein
VLDVPTGPHRRLPEAAETEAVLRPHWGWAVANLVFLVIGLGVIASQGPDASWHAVKMAGVVIVPTGALAGALAQKSSSFGRCSSAGAPCGGTGRWGPPMSRKSRCTGNSLGQPHLECGHAGGQTASPD